MTRSKSSEHSVDRMPVDRRLALVVGMAAGLAFLFGLFLAMDL